MTANSPDQILLLTVESVPWSHEIIGLAAASTGDYDFARPGHTAALAKALDLIQQHAHKLRADAVLGLRLTSASSSDGWIWVAATGTAVRWVEAQRSQIGSPSG